MGKSYEWKKIREAHKGLPDFLFLNLGSFPAEETLRREIVDSPAVKEWRTNDSILTLWLDRLDEGLLHTVGFSEVYRSFGGYRMVLTLTNSPYFS